MTAQESKEFRQWAEEFAATVNRDDRAAFKAMWTDDARWYSETTGFLREGPEPIAEWLWSFKSAFPDFHMELLRAFGDGENGLLEMRLSGTHEKPLHTPGIVASTGLIPPSGKHAKWPMCFILEVRDKKAAGLTLYFDLLTFLRGIGAIPEGSPMGARPS